MRHIIFLKKIKHKISFVTMLPVVLVTFLFITIEISTASPSLVNIGVGTKGKFVVMNARLVNGFTNSISEAVESGVPMTFTFDIELRQKNLIWNDTLISSNVIQHTIKYDSLKKVYRFSEFGKGVKRKIITRNKKNYQDLMLSLKNIPIASTRSLSTNDRYYVRVKADIDMNRLWFPLDYILFFLPFNDFNSTWEESSPLSIDPEITNINIDHKSENQTKNNNRHKGINNVVRSFNK